MFGGKPRTMGLGPAGDVSLADARRKAKDCRSLAREGIDPIDARQNRRQQVRAEAAKNVSFRHCAERYIEANKAGWRSPKHLSQWRGTLKTYVFPVLGELPVDTVDTGLVTKVLEPIWGTKTETASRVRQRIETVLDWAKARKYRNGDNPARWHGHLDKLLPKPTKIARVRHFDAMPYTELPQFFGELSKQDAVVAKALTFTILTAARSGETRFATVNEIDFALGLWTRPGERTKSRREHRAPLPEEAITLLRSLDLGLDKGALLFPNSVGKPLSDSAMCVYLQKDMGRSGLTVHGFRSTFKDWAHEWTNFPNEVSEAALAHVIGDKTEAAYRRGDAIEKRRRLMEAWAKFCMSGPAATGNVVPLRG
jgi:integrase